MAGTETVAEPTGWDDIEEPTVGPLRRRNQPALPPTTGLASLSWSPDPATPDPTGGPSTAAWTSPAERPEGLYSAVVALRTDMDRSIATMANGLQKQFQTHLEELTATVSGALDQVATHLERLIATCNDNAEAVSAELQGLCGETRANPPVDLTPITDAMAQLVALVDVLVHRIG